MEEFLNRLVEKRYKPKYPWIKDYIWRTTTAENSYLGTIEYIYLTLFYDSDFLISLSYDDKERQKILLSLELEITNDLDSLFKGLPLEPNQKFGWVSLFWIGLKRDL